MGSKGSQTTNTNQTQTYSPTGSNYLTNALNQAQNLSGQGFTVPTAPVAGLTGQQQQAFGLAGNTGISNPYTQQGAQDFTPQGISNFFNPQASAVTAQLSNIFGQQNAQNNGSLAQAAGGLGANRIAVGQGILANQQGLSAGQTLANLYGQSAQEAQSAGYGQLAAGQTAQSANTQDINNLLTTGGLQQQETQAQLNAPYQQQIAQLALPYELSQFGTSAAGALAPALGGTTTGQGTTQSQYNPSLFSQILGAGALGTSLIGGTGGFGSTGWLTGALGKGAGANRGGAIEGYDGGGGVGGAIGNDSPLAGIKPVSAPTNVLSTGLIPQANLPHAQTQMPQLNLNPQTPNMQPNTQQMGQQLMGLTKGLGQATQGLQNYQQDMAQDAEEGFQQGGAADDHPYNFMRHEPVDDRRDNPPYHPSLLRRYVDTHMDYAKEIIKANPSRGVSTMGDSLGYDDIPDKDAGGPVGYDDGGDVDDATRQMGLDQLRDAMLGAGYQTAPGTPGNPFRMPDQGAVQDWKNSTPFPDNIPPPPGDQDALPSIITQGSGSRSTPQTSAMKFSGDDDGSSTATTSIPTPQPRPPGADIAQPATSTSPGNMPAIKKGDDGTQALSNFFQSPWGALAVAGASAFTPAGFSGGLQQAMKLQQGQQQINQGNTRLGQEQQQVNQGETRLKQQEEQIKQGEGRLKLQQQQIEQSAKRLEQEAKFHEDQYSRLTPKEQFEQQKPFQTGQHYDPESGLVVSTYGRFDKSGNIVPALPQGQQQTDANGQPVKGVVASIGDEIIDGRQSPSLTGLNRQRPAIQAYLAQKGFNLEQAQLQERAAQRDVLSLNNTQMVRLVGLSRSVDNVIDRVNDLGSQLHNSGVPLINSAKLQAIMQTEGNSPRGQLAAQYIGAVNTLKEEFANAANGGYAPTEPAWKLANEQINGNYGEQQLGAALKEVQRLVRYRVNSIPGINEYGPGSPNRYMPNAGKNTEKEGAAASPPAAPAAPKANRVTQGGHTYERQPDGSYKPVQ